MVHLATLMRIIRVGGPSRRRKAGGARSHLVCLGIPGYIALRLGQMNAVADLRRPADQAHRSEDVVPLGWDERLLRLRQQFIDLGIGEMTPVPVG